MRVNRGAVGERREGDRMVTVMTANMVRVWLVCPVGTVITKLYFVQPAHRRERDTALRHGGTAALHLGPDEAAFSLSPSTALPMSLVGIPSPWASSCLCASNHLDSSVLDQGFENICRENELGDSRDRDFLGRRAGFIHQ